MAKEKDKDQELREKELYYYERRLEEIYKELGKLEVQIKEADRWKQFLKELEEFINNIHIGVKDKDGNILNYRHRPDRIKFKRDYTKDYSQYRKEASTEQKRHLEQLDRIQNDGKKYGFKLPKAKVSETLGIIQFILRWEQDRDKFLRWKKDIVPKMDGLTDFLKEKLKEYPALNSFLDEVRSKL